MHSKYKYGATYTIFNVSTYESSDTNLSSFRVTWFLTCRSSDPDPLLIYVFSSNYFPPYEILFAWIILSLGVILQPVYPPSKSNLDIFFSSSNKNASFLLCAFSLIFLILWLSLAIDNFPMNRIWLRFRAGIYLIMHVCISISAQLFL